MYKEDLIFNHGKSQPSNPFPLTHLCATVEEHAQNLVLHTCRCVLQGEMQPNAQDSTARRSGARLFCVRVLSAAAAAAAAMCVCSRHPTSRSGAQSHLTSPHLPMPPSHSPCPLACTYLNYLSLASLLFHSSPLSAHLARDLKSSITLGASRQHHLHPSSVTINYAGPKCVVRVHDNGSDGGGGGGGGGGGVENGLPLGTASA